VFTGAGGCGACHTLADAGTTGQVGPNVGTAIVADASKRGLALAAFIHESIASPNAYISPGFPANVMPQSLGSTLSPSQIDALVAYLVKATK
jgi:cytochrome c oxidase subunit 2